MAETLLGVGVVWGIASGATATGIGTFLPQSGDFAVESDMVEVRNGLGQVVGTVHYNQKQTLTLEVIPNGATITAAKAANILPLPGEIVTVTDSVDSEIAALHTGKFIFIRGSKRKSNTDVTKLTMELVQWVENNVAVAVGA